MTLHIKQSKGLLAGIITYLLVVCALSLSKVLVRDTSTQTQLLNVLNWMFAPMVLVLIMGILTLPIIIQRMYEIEKVDPDKDRNKLLIFSFIKTLFQTVMGIMVLGLMNKYVLGSIIPKAPLGLLCGFITGYLYAKFVLWLIQLKKPLSNKFDIWVIKGF